MTERGKPRARLMPADWTARRQRLVEAGLITPAKKPRTELRREDIPEIPGVSLTEILMEERRSQDS